MHQAYLMLLHKRGALRFDDLRTVGGELLETFRDAAIAVGLLKDNAESRRCLLVCAPFTSFLLLSPHTPSSHTLSQKTAGGAYSTPHPLPHLTSPPSPLPFLTVLLTEKLQ